MDLDGNRATARTRSVSRVSRSASHLPARAAVLKLYARSGASTPRGNGVSHRPHAPAADASPAAGAQPSGLPVGAKQRRGAAVPASRIRPRPRCGRLSSTDAATTRRPWQPVVACPEPVEGPGCYPSLYGDKELAPSKPIRRGSPGRLRPTPLRDTPETDRVQNRFPVLREFLSEVLRSGGKEAKIGDNFCLTISR